MKRKAVHLLLLLSLFFNAAHAFIIASQEHCVHETPVEYVMEMSHSNDCGDLCDLHHFFHWSAIVTTFTPVLEADLLPEQPISYKHLHFTTLPQNNIKPPIL